MSISILKSNYPMTLPSPDNFALYKSVVHSLPEISEDDESLLIKEWVYNKSKDAARILVLSNLKLVLKVATDHKGYGLPMSDLSQEGVVGLMKAIHKFNLGKKVRLATYAFYWIDAQIKEYILKNLRLISWGTSSLAKKLFFGYRKTLKFLSSLGDGVKPPSIEDISKSMQVSYKDACAIQSFFMGEDVGLLEESDECINDDQNSQKQPLALLSHDKTPDKILEVYQAQNLPDKILSNLDDRQKSIIKWRYLDDNKKTLSQIASIMGLSIERVRQIESEALKILKDKYRKLYF